MSGRSGPSRSAPGPSGGGPSAAEPAVGGRGDGGPSAPERWSGNGSGSPDGADGPTSYARGWGDGARDAFHYVTRLVSRGHTPSEIRVFVESRLGHLDEEVELKRKTLLSSPSGIPVESLVRVQPKGSTERPAFPPALPGYSYLFLEETRTVARSFVQQLLPRVGRALALTRLPGELRRVAPASQLLILHLGGEGSGEEGVESAESAPNQLTSRVDNFLNETPPPALVYLEGFEFLCTSNSLEISTKFCYWLSAKTQHHQGLLVVSLDPGAFTRAGVATLERDFNHVVRAL